MSEDEGFLQRWSRRKQDALRDEGEEELVDQPDNVEIEVEAETEQNAHENEDAETVEASDAVDPEVDEPEPPGDEDMPPLESLDQGGSIKPFMSPRVSEGLRRAALRRLFRQPKYNVVDMLDDYAEDYSTPLALGNIVTADMRYRAEQAAKRMARIYKESAPGADGEEVGLEEVPDAETGADEHADLTKPPEGTESKVPESEQLADSGDPGAVDEDESKDLDQKSG